jgi:IS5 family transposase
MLRIHFLQQWFSLSDPAMEEALFDVSLQSEFAGLGATSRLPNRVASLRFRPLLEGHRLDEQFLQVVNAHLAQSGLILKEDTMHGRRHLDRCAFLDEESRWGA